MLIFAFEIFSFYHSSHRALTGATRKASDPD